MSMSNNQNDDLSPDPMEEQETSQQGSRNPTPVLFSMFQNLVDPEGKKSDNELKKTQMQLAAAAMAFALTFLPVNGAEAAMSGGRMGGSFESRQSISRPAPSSSYRSGYSRGYSSGYMSRPSVVVTPGIGYGYSPFMSPFSPMISPYGYGGPGVISVSRGPSFFDMLFIGGFIFAAAQIFLQSSRALTSSGSPSLDWGTVGSSALGIGTTVCQISVALEVPDRDDPNSILGVLNRLAQTARTDSRVGVQNLSSQVALELLRRKSSIVSGSTSFKHFNDRSKALREYQSKSVKERSKFENENVSKYGGVDYGVGRSGQSGAASGKATMAVVSIILAIDGDSTKLPRINSIGDVEQALRQIASDAKVGDCLNSAEILWTPEDRSETLTLRDVVADYPELRSV